MPGKKKTKVLEGNYVLPRNLEITGIDKIYQEMKEFTQKAYKKMTLDSGEVALIDTAGVQLLVQLVRTLKSNDCELVWENDSIQIYQMAEELGLAEQLDA